MGELIGVDSGRESAFGLAKLMEGAGRTSPACCRRPVPCYTNASLALLPLCPLAAAMAQALKQVPRLPKKLLPAFRLQQMERIAAQKAAAKEERRQASERLKRQIEAWRAADRKRMEDQAAAAAAQKAAAEAKACAQRKQKAAAKAAAAQAAREKKAAVVAQTKARRARAEARAARRAAGAEV